MRKNPEQEIQSLLLKTGCTIKDALEALTQSKRQIVFMVDENKKVLGCLTDGDIRRALLRGETIQSPIEKAVRKTFVWVGQKTSSNKIFDLMRKMGVRQIPILDDQSRLVRVRILDEFVNAPVQIDCPVVIMAGGKGSRLRPFTENVPKPLLKIGDQTLIERVILDLQRKGARRFFITVNYLADQVKEHLGSGERFGCEIQYIAESKPLGTAGSLSLLKGAIDTDFLVVNGDVLSTVDLYLLSDFHKNHEAVATVCAKMFSVTIPYGVVRVESHSILDIEEKPDMSYIVNSGIYFFSPEVLNWIEPDQPLDMPVLLKKLISAGKSVKCFQSTEPWIDIGSHHDFERAQKNLEHFVPAGLNK